MILRVKYLILYSVHLEFIWDPRVCRLFISPVLRLCVRYKGLVVYYRGITRRWYTLRHDGRLLSDRVNGCRLSCIKFS